jgi:maltose/maltodextrin transport system substrate-binding protein/arabinogalactan oligomer/maltooligosaccharide transport system substrate-binding protein
MRRKSLLISLLVLASFVFATPAAAQDRPDLLIWADATRTPALQPIVEAFAEEFGVSVEVQEVGMGDIRSNIAIAGPAGEGPDIIIAAHDWIGELVLNGSVVPIDLGDTAELFSSAALDLFTYNGQLYGMPYAAENVAFIRNPELVPDAPATWDDVRAVTEELVSSGASQYGYLIQTADAYHFYPLMSAFGGYLFGRTDTGDYNIEDVGLDGEGAISALAWIEGMAQDGYLPTAVDYDVMHSLFESGDAAMIITGPWALPRIRQAGAPYAISDIPSGPGGAGTPFVGGQGFMVSAYSENVLLAESFLIDYMATEESMRALYDADPRPPAFLPLLETLDDADLSAFQHAGQVGVPQPSVPGMTSVWGAWQNGIQFVIQGDLDATAAFTDAAAQVRTVMAGGSIEPEVATTGDTPPEDGPQNVSIPGSLGAAAGCPGDWQPECEVTQLAYNANSDVWIATFDLPAGDYEYKVALDNAWDVNYGGRADRDGANVVLSLAEDTSVTFVYGNATNWVADNVNSLIASIPGSFQDEIGCAGDWAPDCLRSWLQDVDGDGVYTFSTTAIPAGDYEAKVALNMAWDVNYGADGARDGANLTFNVPSDGTEVLFSFDSSSNVLTITVSG